MKAPASKDLHYLFRFQIFYCFALYRYLKILSNCTHLKAHAILKEFLNATCSVNP